MRTTHPAGHGAAPAAPETEGRVIHWAPFYDTVAMILSLGRAGAIPRATADLAAIRPGQTVVDLGCGTGDLAIEAARRTGPAGTVIGIDPSPEMVRASRRKGKRKQSTAAFRLGVAEAIDLPEASCDVVFSSLMLHHLPGELQGRMLAEVRRILRPGGRFVVVDLMATGGPGGHGGHGHLGMLLHRGHALQSGTHIADAFRACGFRDIESGKLKIGGLGYVRGIRGGESDDPSLA